MSLGGDEYVLRHGDYTAVVTEIGGGLRAFRHEDRDLVRSYAKEEVRPRYRGALLAPWPNRVVDGRYSFDHEPFQLDINEPERGHALHGLVSWARFDLLDSDSSSVVLGHPLVPRSGYPFCLRLVVRYVLDDDGLTCTVSAANTGERRLPYGVAAHPYLVAGSGKVDDWILDLPAAEVLEVTPDRLVPTGLRPVAATGLDFREPRRIAATEVDHAFTSIPGASGRVAPGSSPTTAGARSASGTRRCSPGCRSTPPTYPTRRSPGGASPWSRCPALRTRSTPGPTWPSSSPARSTQRGGLCAPCWARHRLGTVVVIVHADGNNERIGSSRVVIVHVDRNDI